jgi:cytochrome c oxidase subunit III
MSSHRYYVPEQSHWPIVGSLGLFLLVFGAIHLFHARHALGIPFFAAGLLVLLFMMIGWLGNVVHESRHDMHSHLMDRSYRWGMTWFIFSEIMLFSVFFGALFYARHFSVPWLGGEGHGATTNEMLWPNFSSEWPLYKNPNPSDYVGPTHILRAWGIPALNTVILLTSAVTLTWAHWALKANRRSQLIAGLSVTVCLGALFLSFQGYEYFMAHTHDGLRLSSGIYGSTFFMLTGLHGLHVTIGAIALTVILVRCLRGHFTATHHFGFEACAWYWHFVDYVWMLLFVFVYWL